jgi:hypothetical protein
MLIDARIPVHFTDPPPGAARPDHAPGAARPDHAPDAARSDQVLILSETAGAPPAGEHWAAVARLPERPASPSDAHPPGCSCCAPRGAVAMILIGLFQARARGEIGFFRSVVAKLPASAAAELREALLSDSFVAGCFVEAKTTQ